MEVDETSIPDVAVGQQAEVHLDAYPNRTFRGVVTEVGSSPIARATGQATEAIKFEVRVRLEDPPPTIKPGLTVHADILTGFRSGVLTVPLQALVVREADEDEEEPAGGGSRLGSRDVEGVYVVEEKKVTFRPLRTGLLGELSIEVLEGLGEGETIVTGPFRVLRDLEPGDEVREEEEPDE